jgi:type I restriction-modification system DNA methylase subunit
MSEELVQKKLTQNGIKISNYEFYHLGNTNLSELKKHNIIPNKNYGDYELRKPDALLVDRRNKKEIRVISVLEYKNLGILKSKKELKKSIEQCNDLCQVLNSSMGIITDSKDFYWINPEHELKENEYLDRTTSKKRSYSLIFDEENKPLINPFSISEEDNLKKIDDLKTESFETLFIIDKILSMINSKNSKLIKPQETDPTSLAKQIWQDVWTVSGATPERCLYTFVELFIFKYLSDLKILNEDEFGNKVNFDDIIKLSPDKAFSNYVRNVRPYLKKKFPANEKDNTTIINGTVLNPNVPEHSQVFYKLLLKFEKFGELKNIDPSFKSRVFEEFMKESISKKNWGQFFTPRNVIDAIIKISDIENLPEKSKICDPACGVGGFLLEPIKVKNDGVNFYYKIKDKKLISRFEFKGYDKGFEKEEQLTIILAKANMLIFLSELLKKNPSLSENFAELFNSTFQLYNDSILGSLSENKKDYYDLILTNPPYAQKGSSNLKEAIKNNPELKSFFTIDASGIEGLFMEKIIRELKPNRKAFVVIPHSILDRLHDVKLRNFIMETCFIDGIISLPSKTFYKTLKKTYILCLTKKENKKIIQNEPIFTYLITDIGESLDIYRAKISKNDLPEMVKEYKYFLVDKKNYSSNNPKIKIQDVKKFEDNINNWCVDRWWSKEEKVKLGIEEVEEIVDIEDYKLKINELGEKLKEISSNLKKFIRENVEYVEEPLSKLFSIGQGDAFYTKKRILTNNWIGEIPVYSSNTKEEGLLIKIKEEYIKHKDKYYEPCLTWAIDGDAGSLFVRNIGNKNKEKESKYLFTINNHSGILLPKKDNMDLEYMKIILEPMFKKSSRSYNNKKVGSNQIENLIIKVPIKSNGEYDLDKQKKIAEKYIEIERIKKQISTELIQIVDMKVDLL